MRRPALLVGLTTLIAGYHIVVVAQIPTWFGLFIPNEIHLAVSLSAAMTLIFLTLPARRARRVEGAEDEWSVRKIPWYDYLLLASTLISTGFVIFFYQSILKYAEYGYLDTTGMVFSIMLVIPLFEAVRRTTGWALPIIILFFVLITIFQQYLPGLLYGRGYPIHRLLYSSYVGSAGVFGLPLGIAANIIIVFLVFGALMQAAGASHWFMDTALALTGKLRGGPAKAAVVASAMFGSISGSPSSNAATTGVFTIPMMKSIGYTPAFAAAVEAVASTGGIILPPVMGAMAFLMAEWIEVTYSAVVAAALVPALLYFLIVFVSVHLQAKKAGIRALAETELPRFLPVLRRGWYYMIPVAALVYFLIVSSYPPGMAGIYACGFVVAVSFISRDPSLWLTPRKIVLAFHDGVGRWITVASITAAVGIMIGALELSGVGIKVSRFIVELAGGNLLLTLIFVGLVSLVVGMGLDATPAYVTLATLMAPALVRLGVSEMAAHLYVIYWGLASFYTPPTCIAVFVTSSIANSKVWRTGWEAMRIGIAAYVIPFAFVFNDRLLMQGTVSQIALAGVTAFVGAAFVASAIQGYLLGSLNSLQRLVILAGGLLLIAPGIVLPVAGLGAIAIALSPKLICSR